MTHNMIKHQICGQIKGTVSSRYLLNMLIDLSNDKGEFIMSLKKLRKLTGLSVYTIFRNMRLLKRMGYINIVHRTTCDGGRASNQYVLNMEKLYT